MPEIKTIYDLMREADFIEEDAYCPYDWNNDSYSSDKEKYFEFYDDIKTTPKDDW